MKTITGALAILALSSGAFLLADQAQVSKVVAKSYYVLSPEGLLITLPPSVGQMKSTTNKKLAVVGVARTRTFIEISEERSPVRIKQGDPQAFVFGPDVPFPDAYPLPGSPLAILHHLEPNKGTRELVWMAITATVVTAKSSGATYDPMGIRMNFSHYPGGAIKMEPRTPLTPGEYAFLAMESDGYENSYRLHCFGVD